MPVTRMQIERAERQGKTEISRLNAENSSLRQRIDRADADLLHSRRENLRLCDQISNLEKEVSLGLMFCGVILMCRCNGDVFKKV